MSLLAWTFVTLIYCGPHIVSKITKLYFVRYDFYMHSRCFFSAPVFECVYYYVIQRRLWNTCIDIGLQTPVDWLEVAGDNVGTRVNHGLVPVQLQTSRAARCGVSHLIYYFFIPLRYWPAGVHHVSRSRFASCAVNWTSVSILTTQTDH